MRTLHRIAAVVALVVLTACSAATDDGPADTADTDGSAPSGATRGDVGGNDALRWGDGDRAVVLAHGAAFDAASWAGQATLIAEAGFTVVAVEDIAPDAIGATVDALRDEGIEDVTLLGGSAGADGILRLAADRPDLPSALILLSPNTVVEGLGTEPKLFVASEDEGVADVSSELARTSPGPDNEAVLLPGSAHAQNIFDTDRKDEVEQLILDRLSS